MLRYLGGRGQNALMRSGLLVLACSWCLTGCGDHAGAAASPDRLVLEVGGEHGSLRAALRAAGVEVAPDRERPRTQPDPAAPGDAGTEPPPTAEDPAHDPARPGEPTPPAGPARAASEPDHVVVTLARGQTLIHLARQHLGDGNRFREILALNGWSEPDSRRLQAGQRVRIPRAAPGR